LECIFTLIPWQIWVNDPMEHSIMALTDMEVLVVRGGLRDKLALPGRLFCCCFGTPDPRPAYRSNIWRHTSKQCTPCFCYASIIIALLDYNGWPAVMGLRPFSQTSSIYAMFMVIINCLLWINKNLAIANRSCTQQSKTSIGLNNTMTLKCRVTQGHWKWNHWIDHTRLTISHVIWHWILWPWNMG